MVNIDHKLQRLHALRLQRDHVAAEIRALEIEIADALIGCERDRAGKKRHVRNAVHVETPIVRHEQDFGAWSKRRAEMDTEGRR